MRTLVKDLVGFTVAAIVALLLACGLAFGQSVTLPAEVKGAPGSWVIIAPEKVDGGKPKWRIDAGLQEVRLDLLLPPETLATLRGKVVTATKPGRYKVEAWNAKGDVASDIATVWVVIGEPGPDPKPPDPDPKPPDPKPVVPVGFRVLLIHEAQDKSPSHFDARSVKQYLDAKTVKDAGHPSWRRLDKDQTGANLPTELRLLWEAAKPKVTSLPAVVIAVNSQVTIHALPADEAGLMALLRSKGGE